MADSWRGMRSTNHRLALRLRRAQHADSPDIRALCQQTQTLHKTLPDVYHELLQQKDVLCIIAHFGKYIACFAVFTNVAETTMCRRIFIMPWRWERLNLKVVFTTISTKIIKSNLPLVQNMVYLDEPTETLIKQLETSDARILSKQNVVEVEAGNNYRVGASSADANVQELSADANVQELSADANVQELSADANVQELSADANVQELSADANVQELSAAEITRLLSQNASTLVPEGLLYAGSMGLPHGVAAAKHCLSPIHTIHGCHKDGQITGFCTSTSTKCQNNILTSVHFYGDWPVIALRAAINKIIQRGQKHLKLPDSKQVIQITSNTNVDLGSNIDTGLIITASKDVTAYKMNI